MLQYEEIKHTLRIASQINFWAFCCYMDFDFFYVRRRFLKEVAEAFQYVLDEYMEGRSRRIAISMPPRSGKSYITSLFAAYWLAQFPELSVMRNTCTARLYIKFSYATRALIRSKKFREVFPYIELAPDKQNLDGWSLTTSKQVAYFGAGVGGTIIGEGANIAITDDLYKGMSAALSDAVQDSTKMWKSSEHDSRKEKNCPEIFVGTRWSKNDVLGDEIEFGVDKIITIPALDENEQSFCEDVKSTEEYLIERSKLESRGELMTWYAEYMQQPVELEGLLLPLSELKFEDMRYIDVTQAHFRLAATDPADTGGDKFSMPFCAVFADNELGFRVYVKKVIHNKDGIEVNADRAPAILSECMIDDCFVETNGVGISAYHLLKRNIDVKCEVKGLPAKNTESKEAKILSNYEFIRKYFVFDSNYKDDPEYKMFIGDLTSYMKDGENKHKKDAIDVLSFASIILKIKYRSVLYGR